ncbi:hypothetical protein [Burkholderia cepacia]|uniref:hypothetical protein n=1 Tax=Burkholderia cepacia TaxID=292 RepID=UPI00158C9A1E|nr:hypothetical protein [Burkholderia cepacia]
MKAIGFYRNLPISTLESLVDLALPELTPGEHGPPAEVHSVSVNPVDVKVRASMAPEAGQPKVIGSDAERVSCVGSARM